MAKIKIEIFWISWNEKTYEDYHTFRCRIHEEKRYPRDNDGWDIQKEKIMTSFWWPLKSSPHRTSGQRSLVCLKQCELQRLLICQRSKDSNWRDIYEMEQNWTTLMHAAKRILKLEDVTFSERVHSKFCLNLAKRALKLFEIFRSSEQRMLCYVLCQKA